MVTTRSIKVLDGVTATTTSNKIYVGNAKKIGFLFRRADHASGKTVFSVNIGGEPEDTVTPTMTATNMLITNTATTNSQTITRVASIDSGAANGDFYAWLDPFVVCTWISVTATETTDGTHSAWIIIQTED